jgi:hypothetical protein
MTKFRSGLEKKVAALLDDLGVGFEYEAQKLPYVLECNYTPDFILPSGIILETKGQFTPEDRRKMLAVIKAHPELDIRMVFQAPFNRIEKRSKTTYAAWCDRHKIKWCAFHSIPVEWLKTPSS